ncbi:hypothetical protein [Synechococcus sp. MIT S9503]
MGVLSAAKPFESPTQPRVDMRLFSGSCPAVASVEGQENDQQS